MALSAPAVSAKLKAAGFGIVTTRNREGIRVSRGALAGRVTVCVDLDRPGEQRRTAALLLAWLEDNAEALGWAWSRHMGDPHQFTLTHKPLPTPEEVSKWMHPTNQANRLQADVRFGMLGLQRAVEQGSAPAQSDITAARTALEALIKLAEEGK